MSFAIPLPHIRTRRVPAPHPTQEQVQDPVLDPEFVKTVKTVTPLDPGVGRVAATAMEAYGVMEFVDQGEKPEAAKQHAQRVAKTLSAVGEYAVHLPEEELERLESVAPQGKEAQVALNAMATLASRQPDSYYGSQAASFIEHVDQSNTHVRLG